MKRLIITLIAGILAFGSLPVLAHPAHAEYVVTDGLSGEQKAEMALQVEKLKKNNRESNTMVVSAPTQDTVDKVSKYAEMGSAIGKGLVSTAKELGVAVNEFSSTPVGKMTMFLIVWNYFGAMLTHLVVGSMFFTTMIAIWIYVCRRFVFLDQITYTPISEKSFRRKKEIVYKDVDSAYVGGMLFVLLIITVAAAIITFAGW